MGICFAHTLPLGETPDDRKCCQLIFSRSYSESHQGHGLPVPSNACESTPLHLPRYAHNRANIEEDDLSNNFWK